MAKKRRNCTDNRVGFVGWLVGWFDGWILRFFRVQTESKWIQDTSYGRTLLAPLGINYMGGICTKFQGIGEALSKIYTVAPPKSFEEESFVHGFFSINMSNINFMGLQ